MTTFDAHALALGHLESPEVRAWRDAHPNASPEKIVGDDWELSPGEAGDQEKAALVAAVAALIADTEAMDEDHPSGLGYIGDYDADDMEIE